MVGGKRREEVSLGSISVLTHCSFVADLPAAIMSQPLNLLHFVQVQKSIVAARKLSLCNGTRVKALEVDKYWNTTSGLQNACFHAERSIQCFRSEADR